MVIVALIILFMSAAWMTCLGMSFKVTGGFLGWLVFKIVPVALSFGLLLIAVNNL